MEEVYKGTPCPTDLYSTVGLGLKFDTNIHQIFREAAQTKKPNDNGRDHNINLEEEMKEVRLIDIRDDKNVKIEMMTTEPRLFP